MKTSRSVIVALIAGTALVSGCASNYSRPAPSYSSSAPTQSYSSTYGVVDSIEVVHGEDTGMAGTVIGGVIGGVLGHQVGGGRGNTAATIAGAAGGAVVGHEIEKNKRSGDRYQVRVRLENGRYQTVTQDDVGDMRVGSRVRIENDRVYPN